MQQPNVPARPLLPIRPSDSSSNHHAEAQYPGPPTTPFTPTEAELPWKWWFWYFYPITIILDEAELLFTVTVTTGWWIINLLTYLTKGHTEMTIACPTKRVKGRLLCAGTAVLNWHPISQSGEVWKRFQLTVRIVIVTVS